MALGRSWPEPERKQGSAPNGLITGLWSHYHFDVGAVLYQTIGRIQTIP